VDWLKIGVWRLNKPDTAAVESLPSVAALQHSKSRRRMAKIKLNPAVASMHGRLGDMVHRRLWGQQVVSHPPDFSERVPSEKQRSSNDRFKTGSVQWTGLPSDVKDRYRARAKELEMPPCGLFHRTRARPPVVEAVDLSEYTGQAGQLIRIRATDLVDLAAVGVIVRLAGGTELERGTAARVSQGERWWTYQTTAAAEQAAGLTVEAVATNWAGRSGSRMQMLGV
jgi:hypothetical protein